MRLWMVHPSMLCRQHLLGEHVESHMFVGAILKGKSLKGYIENGLVEVHNLKERHDALALEMERRGYSHSSPCPSFKAYEAGKVYVTRSIEDLCSRCEDCKRRLYRYSDADIATLEELEASETIYRRWRNQR